MPDNETMGKPLGEEAPQRVRRRRLLCAVLGLVLVGVTAYGWIAFSHPTPFQAVRALPYVQELQPVEKLVVDEYGEASYYLLFTQDIAVVGKKLGLDPNPFESEQEFSGILIEPDLSAYVKTLENPKFRCRALLIRRRSWLERQVDSLKEILEGRDREPEW